MNILMTGATGFLGRNLLRALVNNGHQMTVLKRSFSDISKISDILLTVHCHDLDKINPSELYSIFQQHRIEVVIHAATDYGRKNINYADVLSANLILPLQLLCNATKTPSVQAFINTDTIIDKRVSAYSLSKHQFREWMMFYAYNLKCINVSLEHFYGFQDDKTKFVSNIIDQILKSEPAIDLTLGEQERDFIYIDDVVSALLTIIEKLDQIESGYINLDVGSGNNISIRECVEYIKKVANNKITKLNFGTLPYREHELMKSCADISTLIGLGWIPKTTFWEGIAKTIALEKKWLNI